MGEPGEQQSIFTELLTELFTDEQCSCRGLGTGDPRVKV